MNAIDGSEAILPTEFSKRYELSLFNTTNFGEDPFPDVNLYNNMKSSFFKVWWNIPSRGLGYL